MTKKLEANTQKKVDQEWVIQSYINSVLSSSFKTMKLPFISTTSENSTPLNGATNHSTHLLAKGANDLAAGML